MASLRGKNPKTIAKRRLTAIRSKRSLHIIAVLLIAAVGSYLVFESQAYTFDQNAYHETRNASSSAATILRPIDNAIDTSGGHSRFVAPPNSIIDGNIYLYTPDKNNDIPISSVYFYLSYDTAVATFAGSTCVWKYGCTVTTGDNLVKTTTEPISAEVSSYGLHKAQVLWCFNVPAKAAFDKTVAATYQFKRTNDGSFNRKFANDDWTSIRAHAWKFYMMGSRRGTCESNSDFKGIFINTRHPCDAVVKCRDGSDPGAKGATLTGFGNGGAGNGGEGTGNNGVGAGVGPGPGGGAGGGGSSANRQADKPNTLPSPAPQGIDEPQPELEPNPFFDGKDFERGSDTDNLVFGSSTIGGKKVPKILLYILSAVLLGGAGGGLYWRWRRR